MILPAGAADAELLEVVRITDPMGWFGWTDTVPGETVALWTDAQSVLAQVAALPSGTLMRCFSPRFALRAHAGTAVLFELAFCFSCERVGLYSTGGRSATQTFDPASPPAVELLRRFRESPTA
ncbi:hypothetical protein [Streptomyces tateyamensis]|uniref:hypothetical protein n=1 Tax=Streptomyces tateyamensis TaxID=565073 RepID=UPI0015E8DD55|nr:hypothetical protein [Streptomyces tateyamensis]